MERLSQVLSVEKGDITKCNADCIVNAANRQLRGGGGVDGAIHRAAGFRLLQECKAIAANAKDKGEDACPVGEVRVTPAFDLTAKYVIHAVGPYGEKPGLLARCYKNAMNAVKELKMKSVAFPCISTGVYRYPVENAACVATDTLAEWLDANKDYEIERIHILCFTEDCYQSYRAVLPAECFEK